MYDVRRLRLLKELADRGTLAEVAAALRFSPSTVSQQLALLEREVGVPLLMPSGRRVVLTPEAQTLAARAGEVLDLLERAEAEVAARTVSVAGTVRLAIFQSAALALLPQTLSVVATEHPRLRVEVVQHEPESALQRTATRDFDLVVAEQYPGHATAWHEGLDHRPLVLDPLRLAVPAASGVRALADAQGEAWVLEPRGAASRHWADQQCRLAGFEPDVRYESADLEVHMRLVESGNAVAMLPDLVWSGRRAPGRMIVPEGAPQREVFTAARVSGADRPAVAALRAALERAAA
ncbi:LysR family transcriptional regulator [Amnibacterium kyonggiense]|uniref:DNA-binding transcriptional LysR family regulator n=1 Tax=Amnibacterium kyonggiense TaxID=595671 RepID=A0A4R7FPW9_9MICO|nr:LysR family transcriptional regulator [Amnibacterium kyonggiense]TDS79817.1 DNA-binding transcriptional LysR family regulator [Amnibacterium kyonggiense]